jgi:hypothetical protein
MPCTTRHALSSMLLSALVCSCGNPNDASQPAIDDAPAVVPESGFVGRVWVATSPGPEHRSIMVFLADRTFLRDACPGPLQVSEWDVAGERIRWRERSIPIEAVITLLRRNELHVHVVGQSRPQHYVEVSPPFTCPDAAMQPEV